MKNTEATKIQRFQDVELKDGRKGHVVGFGVGNEAGSLKIQLAGGSAAERPIITVTRDEIR